MNAMRDVNSALLVSKQMILSIKNVLEGVLQDTRLIIIQENVNSIKPLVPQEQSGLITPQFV